jgi:uncharacterized protein
MTKTIKTLFKLLACCMLCLTFTVSIAQSNKKPFHVIAFYTARNDQAHISFVHEANKWFPEMGKKYNFTYDSTKEWTNMNAKFLAKYQAVIFLDTRVEDPVQRKAFEEYMKSGGGWIGFHFAGFALTPSDFNADWDWYHNEFLGSGQYVSNTWRPVSAFLRVEDHNHPATKGLPDIIKSSPSEWYRWEKDLRQNADIKILLSVDSTSFPLGTGPKLNEIWHSGYYPIVWTNKNYKMVYFNFGHNDIDYEHHTNKELSHTFNNPEQDKLILNSLIWVATGKKVN